MTDRRMESIGCMSQKHAFLEKLKFRFGRNNRVNEIILNCLYDSGKLKEILEDNTFERNLALSQSMDPSVAKIRERLERSEDKC